MAFDNLSDAQVRDIAGSANGFFDVNQLKALLELADTVAAAAGTIDVADVPNLPASKISTGTLAAARLPTATTAAKGSVNQAAAQADSTATDVAGLRADFNALLAKLRTAGILA